MTEPGVYLEKLSAFARMLRREGLPIGPMETGDAARILEGMGFESREGVKTALRTVFAKSREEQIAFDRVFDGFFLSQEAMESQVQHQAREEQTQEEIRRQAQESMKDVPLSLDEEQWRAYASMPKEERERLERFMEKYRDNAQRNPRLYGEFIHSVFAKAILEQQLLLEDAGLGGNAADPELGMLYRDISRFKDTEIPKAIDLIQAVARQLNGELSSKRRRQGHSGRPDFRRTIRKGLETGGTFYRLKYRKKRSRRKSLVLLCDVSGSMMQFSEFALRFIQALNRASESSRTFLFSEGLFEADAFSLEDMDKFRDYVKRSGLYGRGTDLGSALGSLLALRPCPLNPATTLIILSDTKTVNQPGAAALLIKAKAMAGRVLWMNPIPREKWKYLNSVRAMESLCTMVPCSTLGELAAACRRLG